jgi:hypothetical protein
MAGLLSGAHELADKAVLTFGTAITRPDAAGSDPDSIVASGHADTISYAPPGRR